MTTSKRIGEDVSWRWWQGKTDEEEWNATSEACGARAMVVKKYYPNAFKRMSQYQIGRLTSVELPKTKSSNPNAELMFCDSCILNRQDHCTGFNYCVEHAHHTGQRFWFCDDCSKCYYQRLSQGKNIHFDEDERAKEEWIKVEVEVVTTEVFQSLKRAEQQLKHNITRNE
jgi:hypothetical protein